MKKLLIVFFVLLLVFTVGCSVQEETPNLSASIEETNSGTDVGENIADLNEVAVEDMPSLFSSVDEMTEEVVKERQTKAKDVIAQSNELEGLSTTYAPAKDYEGFLLWNVEVNPNRVFYYYVPAGERVDSFDWAAGITVTVSRNSKMTLDSVCAQNGITPDADGFAYNAGMSKMYFAQDGTVISVHVPEHMNDYDTIRSLCEMEKIEIP